MFTFGKNFVFNVGKNLGLKIDWLTIWKWCKWCKWFKYKWCDDLNVNDVNDVNANNVNDVKCCKWCWHDKLRNDKTDLQTLLSLQNWPQTSLITETSCP